MIDTPPADLDAHDVEIRLVEPEDYPSICALFNESLIEGQLSANDTGADIENIEDGYFHDEGASGFWVAARRGDVIGMIGVQQTRKDTAEMRRLRVHDDYRRRGIGTQLMQHAIGFCRQRGYLKVVLDVRVERGPAIALFEKCGFKLGATREIDDRRVLDFYIDLYREPRA